jgi:hypothetical protein
MFEGVAGLRILIGDTTRRWGFVQLHNQAPLVYRIEVSGNLSVFRPKGDLQHGWLGNVEGGK